MSARIYSLVITKLPDTSEPAEPVITTNVQKVSDVVTENDGKAAVGYVAEFAIQGTKSVNGCTWSITPSGSDTPQIVESIFTGPTIEDSTVLFGLVVTSEKDKAYELSNIDVSAELK